MAYPETAAVLDFHFSRWGVDAIYRDPDTEGETPVRVILDASAIHREGRSPGANEQPRFTGGTVERIYAMRLRVDKLGNPKRGATVRLTDTSSSLNGHSFRLDAPMEDDGVAPEWIVTRLD